MARDRLFTLIVCIGLIALLAGGLLHLFVLRYQAGDVYPAYSSLRSDPLGAKVFCESLKRMPKISVTRNLQSLSEVIAAGDTTLFYLGTSLNQLKRLPEEEAQALDSFVLSGGRLVMTISPSEHASTRFVSDKEKKETKEKKTSKAKKASFRKKAGKAKARQDKHPDKDTEEEERMWPSLVSIRTLSLLDRWTFECAEMGPDQHVSVSLNPEFEPLPESLPWHSALIFRETDEAWQPVYLREEQPVLIFRDFGRGSIVLSGDSYLLSNEAMGQDRKPELLTWFVGSSHRILFDETHLGVRETPGVATLVRQYGLHGMVATLLILALLAIWMNASGFLPPQKETQESSFRAGKDFVTGMASLLRRNISSQHILQVAFDEWKKSAHVGPPAWTQRMTDMQELMDNPSRDKDPVSDYQALAKILAERKSRHGSA